MGQITRGDEDVEGQRAVQFYPQQCAGAVEEELSSWVRDVGLIAQDIDGGLGIAVVLEEAAGVGKLTILRRVSPLTARETLFQLGHKELAAQELEKVLTATRHAVWPEGLEEDRQQAFRLRFKTMGRQLGTSFNK